MLQFIKSHRLSLIIISSTLVLISCANMGQGPQGGVRDWSAPKLTSISPKPNSTNVKNNKVELKFNKNVTIKDKNDKIIVTPPQRKMPVIRSANNKVTVELRDTLQENTTYTIDFTNAIEDTREGNPLENFAVSFSTGDVVDSLTVSGIVIQAEDNEPVKGYYVGLHANLDDTAFTKTPFIRISRTNDRGEFTIRGIGQGKYHIFALDDKNRDYMYDNPMEALAFFDQILEPVAVAAVRYDTIYADTAKQVIDSIKMVNYTRFTPDNIVMKSFLSDKRREYFRNAERKEGQLFKLNFGTATQKPVLEPLNFDSSIDWVVQESNLPKDSIYTYWIKDQSIIKMDTLLFNMTYNMTDTLNQLVSKTDTLRVINRERKREKKKKDDEEEEIVFLEIKTNAKDSWDIFEDIEFEFSQPLKGDSLKSFISFQQKVDTLYEDVEFELIQDSLNPRKYAIDRKLNFNEEYRINIDSASIFSIYGLWNNKLNKTLRVKDENKYATLAVMITGVPDSIPSFVELLDSSGKPFRKAKVIDNGALFRNINPGKYYARIILDENNNFKWDTGDYETQRQPEAVYYYPSAFEARAHWEDIINFDVKLDDYSKPLDILKNKPVDNKKRGEMLDEQEREKYEQEQQRQLEEQERLNPGSTARNGTRNTYNY